MDDESRAGSKGTSTANCRKAAGFQPVVVMDDTYPISSGRSYTFVPVGNHALIRGVLNDFHARHSARPFRCSIRGCVVRDDHLVLLSDLSANRLQQRQNRTAAVECGNSDTQWNVLYGALRNHRRQSQTQGQTRGIAVATKKNCLLRMGTFVGFVSECRRPGPSCD